jgi:hypothetical protein
MYYENLRVFTHSGTQEAQTIKTFILEHNTLCDVLIVGGGGGGDRCQVGAGGGGGGVLYGQNIIIPAGSYQLKIGTGGSSNSTGHNSEGFGATVYGGATTIYTPWPTGNAGSAGGSGSGGSAGNSTTGTMQNGGGVTASIKGTILAASTVYGNAGGKSRTTANSMSYGTGGGGGAGGIGHDSLAEFAGNCVNRTQYLAAGSPSKGRNGIMIPILGLDYYWAAGGGGGNYNSHGGDGGIGGGGGGGLNMTEPWKITKDVDDNNFEPLINKILDSNESWLINGPPGAGKTTLINKIKEYLNNNGKAYKCLAPTNLAALLIDGTTVHKFACKLKKLTKFMKTDLHYIFVDEVSMLHSNFYKILMF